MNATISSEQALCRVCNATHGYDRTLEKGIFCPACYGQIYVATRVVGQAAMTQDGYLGFCRCGFAPLTPQLASHARRRQAGSVLNNPFSQAVHA